MSVVAKWLDGSRCHSVWRSASSQATLCYMGTLLPSPKGHSPQFLAHVCCGQTAGRIKMSLGREADVGPDDIVLDGDPAPPKRHSPQFSAHVCPKSCMDQDATWYGGRPRPKQHCVRWRPRKGAEPPPIFGPFYCGQAPAAQLTRNPAIAEGPRDAGVPVEIW